MAATDPPTVTTDHYRVSVDPVRPRAVLTDGRGRDWATMSLVATVHRSDGLDEVLPGHTVTTTALSSGATRLVATLPSPIWQEHTVELDCHHDRLELRTRVVGQGRLTDVTLLGGPAVLATGATGVFRSWVSARSLVVPAPTQPVAVTRPVDHPAQLGIVGDADPGRTHGLFSPPPLCLAFVDQEPDNATSWPEGPALGMWLADPVETLQFSRLGYEPLDGGFLLRLSHDGQVHVDGDWTSPTLTLQLTSGVDAALDAYASAARQAPATDEVPPWWTRPLFCGWGAQCAVAATSPGIRASELARQDRYDAWLARLNAAGLEPGTVVLDDKWQSAYGTAEPDLAKWPDLRSWVATQHEAGRRVLLWWKAWDCEGIPPEECITLSDGTPVAVDPGNPAYQERLAATMARLLGPADDGPDTIGADGLKVDFTQRAPVGSSLRGHGPWGVAGLHRLLHGIHRAAHAARPDALVVTHAVHPGFADCTDMVRLNDVLERDLAGAPVPVVDQLRFRARVAARMLPGTPIDTDQWPMPDREQWRAYTTAQAEIGVPALYYVESIDNSGEPLTDDDLALVRRTWEPHLRRAAP